MDATRSLEEGTHQLQHLPGIPGSKEDAQLPTLIYRSFYNRSNFNDRPLVEVPYRYHVASTIEQSSGYELVHIPIDLQVRPCGNTLVKSKYQMTLSANHSFSRTAISIFQVFYSCTMIYQTKGDQLDRYSWGAFGLTVLPYAIMSVLNLVANTITPVYPTLQLVSSDVLDESRKRGATYGAVAGELSIKSPIPKTWTSTFERIQESPRLHIMAFTPSFKSTEDKIFRARVLIDPRAANASFTTSTGFQPVDRKSWLRHTKVKALLMFIIIFSPLAVAGAMSRFQPPADTHGAMTMIWLALGPVSGFATALKLLFSKKEESFHDWRSTPWSILVYFGLLPVFGMAAVVIMLVDFGTCVRVD